MFVERTNKGSLISSLREKEKERNWIGKKKVKLVEKNGDQLSQILTSSKPIAFKSAHKWEGSSSMNSIFNATKTQFRVI